MTQVTATGILELRAEAVIRAPRGGLVLLATSFDMITTHFNLKNNNYKHMLHSFVIVLRLKLFVNLK